MKSAHVGFFIALEGFGVPWIAQRPAHVVQPVPPPRLAEVEDRGIRNLSYRDPHTSFAVSMQSLSFATSCSTVRLLPWCVLEKPHCGERQRFSIGTYFDAASMRRLRWSFASSSGTLELMSPSTTFLPLGT